MAGLIHGAIVVFGERGELRARSLLLLVGLFLLSVRIMLVGGCPHLADCLDFFASLPEEQLVGLGVGCILFHHICRILICCALMKLL